MRSVRFLAALAFVCVPLATRADVPGGLEVTCDLDRKTFRTAAAGQSDVRFKLFPAPTGGTQLGSEYTVPTSSLVVFKRYTEKFDSVSKRKSVRINAVIGSDGSPVLLPADGLAWMEVAVGTQTLGCDFAATGSATARRRLQSVPFAREGTQVKVGSFTRDTSLPPSSQSVTGVGFTPKAVMFLVSRDTTNLASWGFDDGSAAKSIYDDGTSNVDTYAVGALSSIEVATSAGNAHLGAVTSLDADGFTIAWTTLGSPPAIGTLTVQFLAIR